MRQTEKEWERTLASSLIKEKHGSSGSGIVNGEIVDDGGGMDL